MIIKGFLHIVCFSAGFISSQDVRVPDTGSGERQSRLPPLADVSGVAAVTDNVFVRQNGEDAVSDPRVAQLAHRPFMDDDALLFFFHHVRGGVQVFRTEEVALHHFLVQLEVDPLPPLSWSVVPFLVFLAPPNPTRTRFISSCTSSTSLDPPRTNASAFSLPSSSACASMTNVRRALPCFGPSEEFPPGNQCPLSSLDVGGVVELETNSNRRTNERWQKRRWKRDKKERTRRCVA